MKHYQARLGLRQTGTLDATTLKALNVSAADRARELQQSAQRLSAAQDLPFDKRYVVVNIPAAAVEAVEGGRVVHRYTAVVGGSDHQSPQIVAKITDVVINPAWTLPASIIKNEIIPKMVKNPRYLSRMNIKILDGRGRKVNPRRIDWSSNEATEYTLRHRPGNRAGRRRRRKCGRTRRQEAAKLARLPGEGDPELGLVDCSTTRWAIGVPRPRQSRYHRDDTAVGEEYMVERIVSVHWDKGHETALDAALTKIADKPGPCFLVGLQEGRIAVDIGVIALSDDELHHRQLLTLAAKVCKLRHKLLKIGG